MSTSSMRSSVAALRQSAHPAWFLLPLVLLFGAKWEPRARAGAPLMQQDAHTITAILIGQTPSAAQIYQGQPSLLFVDARSWKPMRLQGSVPKLTPLMTGTLTYGVDARYEHSGRIMSFVPTQPIGAEAIRQRAGKSAQGAVLLAHALSKQDGLSALEATRRELSDEGYAWGLRIFEHRAELGACAKKSASCVYELVALEIESGRFVEAAELLSAQHAQFDGIAGRVHDQLDLHCAPVKTGVGSGNPATGLSWADLLRIACLQQAGASQKAEAERKELLRRAPRHAESTAERYYEGFAPLEHLLFQHDRPRVLYQRASEQRPAKP